MKAAIFSWDPAEVEEVIVALRLRWPDVSALVASNGRSDLATVEQAEPDVVILHGHLPDIDVWSAIRQIRLASDVPILVAMQSDNDMDAVKAFDAGADEYVSLPCDLMAFVARVIALLRRVGVTKPGAQGAVIRCGELLIDPDELAAYLGSERLRLTHTEFRLLYVLAKSSQITLSPEYIRRAIWGDHDDVEGILKKYIQRVRQKLGDDAKNPQWIRTVHGSGISPTGARTDSHHRGQGQRKASSTCTLRIATNIHSRTHDPSCGEEQIAHVRRMPRKTTCASLQYELNYLIQLAT